MKKVIFFSIFSSALFIGSLCLAQIPMLDRYYSPIPEVVKPGAVSEAGGITAPSDAISLFNGQGLSEWASKNGPANWTVHDGVFTIPKGGGDIFTKKEFKDFQLHLEFMHPEDITGDEQWRGNSGVYMHGLYEIQILESYNNDNKTYVNGQAGAIYKQHAPLVNPIRKPGQWNSFDIIFSAPAFNSDGTYKTNPRITVLLNGILIHNNAIIYGGTNDDIIEPKDKGVILLQDHGCPVSFRNFWIREL